MKTQITSIVACLGLPCILTLSALAAGEAPSLEPLQGKWSVTKTNREGRAYSQTIEIKKNQMTLQIFDAEEQLRLHAQGTIKTEKNGPFEVLVVSDIRAGRSVSELESVDDPRSMIYALRGERLFLASNFDRERNNERPTMDVYTRKAAAADTGGTSSGNEAKLLGTWKMELVLGENTLDYELRIARKGESLEGILVSPRTGEHKSKSIQLKDGEVVIEVERELEGNPATFIYQGKLTAEGLAGKFSVKGQDQFSGNWKATKP